jgi:protein arginine kinase
VETLERVVERVLELELEARNRAVEETSRRRRLEDRVHRSRAVLESARMITTSHAMACASDVRLGKWLGYFEDVAWSTLNEFSYRVQPAHLGAPREEIPEPEEAEWLRARWIRRRMGGEKRP